MDKKVKLLEISKNYSEFLEATKEHFFALQTNIQLSGDCFKLIAISSVSKNQGKTTVSIGLANALAKSGHRVLLLDLDIRNSVLRGIFHSQEKVWGVSDYLAGKASMQDILTSVKDMSFYVIGGGRVSPNPVTLLKSEKFANMISAFRKNFEYVIVDTPPIGQVIDAAIITQHCDASFLVTDLGKVTRTQLAQAKHQLEQTGKPFLGAVMNMTSPLDNQYGYYGETAPKSWGLKKRR